MIYLSQMLGKPVTDAAGAEIGTISDIAIATGEVFPHVTSLAFLGPDKTPFMLSWRKYVAEFDGESVTLNVPGHEIRFSYLQPDEVLLHRDLLNKQIVDTQGMKVVRVNDLKLSESRNQLRLLGAEVGARGIVRGISPALERLVDRIATAFGTKWPETLIAWNYMDLLDRDLSQVKLSVTHKRLHELHPADVADILEKLSASQRAAVFAHLDNAQAAEAISELEDEYQADVIDDLTERRASDLLAEMDPDDAADIVGDLPRDKAERLLRLMGVEDATAIRGLLGYKEKTAGGIMTPEVTTVTQDMTVKEVIEYLRECAAEHESVYYVYVVEGDRILTGVISLRDLLLASPETTVADIATGDLFSVNPDEDQEDVAEEMSKYDLLAMPVVDETGKLLGIVTVDDALDVLEEEADEDLELATGRRAGLGITGVWQWVSRDGWLFLWSGVFLGIAALAQFLGGLEVLLLVAVASLVVVRLAEDVASHVTSRVIEGESAEESDPLWRRLLSDGVAGVVLGIVVGVVAFGVIELTLSGIGGTSPNGGVLPVALVAGNAFGLSTFLVTLTGTFIGVFAERRARAEKPVSHAFISMSLQLAAFILFIGLFAGGYALASSTLNGPLG